jgi:DNA-binding Lrp family transcriptional regulator
MMQIELDEFDLKVLAILQLGLHLPIKKIAEKFAYRLQQFSAGSSDCGNPA